MARLARVVVPGVGHPVPQRGNRRRPTFFQEDDYAAYLALLGEWCGRCAVEVWAYCLMPNHVHGIVLPERQDARRRRKYGGSTNARAGPWASRRFGIESRASSGATYAPPHAVGSRNPREISIVSPELPHGKEGAHKIEGPRTYFNVNKTSKMAPYNDYDKQTLNGMTWADWEKIGAGYVPAY